VIIDSEGNRIALAHFGLESTVHCRGTTLSSHGKQRLPLQKNFINQPEQSAARTTGMMSIL